MKIKNLILSSFIGALSFTGISQNLVINGDFSSYDPNCTTFGDAFENCNSLTPNPRPPLVTHCVNNWCSFTRTPSLFGVPTNNPYAWMWSYSGRYESIKSNVKFEKGKCYLISFKIKTSDKNGNETIKTDGTINLRAVNTNNSNTVVNEQTIYTNSIGGSYFENWQTITATFTANANYSELLINPYYAGQSSGGQAEMSIDDIVITAGTISVNFDITDASGNVNNTFLQGEPIFLNGTNSSGEAQYSIYISSKPIGSTSGYQNVGQLNQVSGQLSNLNLTTQFASLGVNFNAGYEYQVQTLLENGCAEETLTKTFIVKEKFIDLYIKDSPADTGLEPNINSPYFWASKDIWVTSSPNGMIHQNPEYSTINRNYIRVKVTNRGTIPSNGTDRIFTYWAKASTGLGWPNPWNGGIQIPCSVQNTTAGNLVSSAPISIPALQPGQSTIVTFPWANIPKPSDYSCFGRDQWHFCLLARIVSTDDPMSFVEGSNLLQNTRNNNNIAWKNISIVDNIADPVVTVAVANSLEKEKLVFIESELKNTKTGKLINDYETPKITIGKYLLKAVERGKSIRDKNLFIKENRLVLDKIAFEPLEFGVITLDFRELIKNLDNRINYEYTLIQRDFKTGEIIGGETFEINNNTKESPIKIDPTPIKIANPILTKPQSIYSISNIVYPNPVKANEAFTIKLSEKIENVKLIDFTGKEVEIVTNRIDDSLKITPIDYTKSGIYFVKIENGNGTTDILRVRIE